MLIIWKIFCILLLSLGAFGVGLGISYLDFFLFFIGLLFFAVFFSSLEASKRRCRKFS
ncbi:putative membrane protein [Acinetobacter baumannii 233846]|nr:putative membrane protein [Acinetobacter baumannii 233846]